MWGYYDAYTAAQIELMSVDCPITVYNRTKDKKDRKGNKGDFKKADALDVMECAEKWEQKYGKGGAGVKLDLGGFKRVEH